MNIYWKVASYLIAIGAVLAGLYFYGESKYDDGYEKREAIAVASALIAEQSARAKERAWQDQLSKVQNEKTERERKLEDGVIAARNSAIGLQRDLTNIRNKLPELTRTSIQRYADTASIVFGECTDAYTGLAATADRIDSDRKALEDSWPR